MRTSWRVVFFVLLLGLWPQFGCVHLFGEKAANDKTPDVKKPAETAQQQPLPVAPAPVDVAQQWYNHADALERAGKPSEAAAVYEKMREAGGPIALQATRKLAALYDRYNSTARAEQEYRYILQHNPRDADALSSLGDIAYRRSHWPTAEKHYKDALLWNKDHAHARISLGLTLAQQEDYEGSLAELKQALGSEAEAYCNVAFVMKLQGKHEHAAGAYQRAVELDPTLPRARTELAKLESFLPRDGNSSTRVTAMKQPIRKGTVDLEPANNLIAQGTDRQMIQRPTLPPLPDWDILDDGPDVWKSSKKK